MNKIEFGWQDLDDAASKIVANYSMYEPEFIIAVNKTGIILGLMLSNYFDIPLGVFSLRNEDGSLNLRELTRISSKYDGKRIIIADGMINNDQELEYLRSYTNATVTSLVTREPYIRNANFFSPVYIGNKDIEFAWE